MDVRRSRRGRHRRGDEWLRHLPAPVRTDGIPDRRERRLRRVEFRIEVGLCATGTYSVSAGSYSDSGEGTYELWFAGGDVDRDGCQASELFEEMSSDGACSTSVGYDGSESGWCDDGSRWYVGADGSGYRTLIDQETGCEVTTNTDGSESGWCGDVDGQGSTQSWWTDEQGNRSEDYWDATTDCSTSTYSDGSASVWCEDGYGSSTDAHGRSETWTETRDEESGCSTTSYDNGRSDTWCEDGSGSWTDENGRTESWIETRDEDCRVHVVGLRRRSDQHVV